MILEMIVVSAAVLACLLIHYEWLRLSSMLIPRLTMISPRARVLVVMILVFGAHTIEVWFFAGAYWATDRWLDFGHFVVHTGHMSSASDFIYYSVVTYTSLGFGDILPTGGMRLLSGVEALLGLLLIGWSASFTYLVMEQFWPLHGSHAWRRFRETRSRPPGEAGEAD